MSHHSPENLKAIRFADELLPDWAQLLDVAARLCPMPEETRHWFRRFTARTGVDDSRTVIEHCARLRRSIEEHRALIAAELSQPGKDAEPSTIIAAWIYALDTMQQAAQKRKTCPWIVEGTDAISIDDGDDGDIELRRV